MILYYSCALEKLNIPDLAENVKHFVCSHGEYVNLWIYFDQSYLYVVIFCTSCLNENISVSSKPITYLQTHDFFQKQILVNVYDIGPSMQRYFNKNAKIILQPDV